MSLSRALLAFFLFLQTVSAVPVVYPGSSNIHCYFFLQGKLVLPADISSGQQVTEICLLEKNNKLYVYAEQITAGSMLFVRVPNDSWRCAKVSRSLTRFLLVSYGAVQDFAVPLQYNIKYICYYSYSYFNSLLLLQYSQGSLFLQELTGNYSQQNYSLEFLENVPYVLELCNVYGRRCAALYGEGALQVDVAAPSVPSTLLLSIEQAVSLPLKFYLGASSLKEVYLEASTAATVCVQGYCKVIEAPVALLVLPNTVKYISVNGRYVVLQRSSCQVYVSLEGVASNCENYSRYSVLVSRPVYGNYELRFYVTVVPYSILEHVYVYIYRNGKLYLSFYRARIMNRPWKIAVVVPYDGSGENNVTVTVVPAPGPAKTVRFELYVPSPVPQVRACIEVQKSYLLDIFLVWAVLTLLIMLALAELGPRLRL
ncbi:MAG: hypothetical protein GXO42_00590 [bacterium]|nr:hypothetical protein [bacterium]